MKKLIIISMLGGFFGFISGVLLIETIVSTQNTINYLLLFIVSLLVSILVFRKLMTEFKIHTRESNNTIDLTRKLIEQNRINK
jgi:uncharacterized membrane protein